MSRFLFNTPTSYVTGWRQYHIFRLRGGFSVNQRDLVVSMVTNIFRENFPEVVRRWRSDLHGRIAEDYEQVLSTPMGRSMAKNLLELAVDYIEAESYHQPDLLHRIYDFARETSYRRAAVGFSLADIVATGMSFRRTLGETLMNHYTPTGVDESRHMLETMLALNRFFDSVVSGDISGYFAYQESVRDSGDSAAVA